MDRTPPKPHHNHPYDYEAGDVQPVIGDWVYNSDDMELLQVVAVLPEYCTPNDAIWKAVATDWQFEAGIVYLWKDGSGWRIVKRKST